MKEKKPIFKKWQIYFLIILAICFVGLKLWQARWPTAVLNLKGVKLNVLVADNFTHQIKGLGGRESLGEYQGMIFIYQDLSQHGIVMRDMKFPIDIVWLNGSKVIDYAQNVPLEPGVSESDLHIYYPRTVGNLVLELPAGWAEKNGLQIGDELLVSSK